MPKQTKKTNASSASYNKNAPALSEARATGTHFSCQIPEGWSTVEETGRPFALAPKKYANSSDELDLQDTNHILYCHFEDIPEAEQKYMFPAVNWAVCYQTAFGAPQPTTRDLGNGITITVNNPLSAQVTPTVEAHEVEAQNCTCYVRHVKVGDFREFYIIPYSPTSYDMLRICFYGSGRVTIAQMTDFADRIAASISLNEPVVSPLTNFLTKTCLESRVDSGTFGTALTTIQAVACSFRQQVYGTGWIVSKRNSRWPRNGREEARIELQAVHAGIEALAELNAHCIPIFEQVIDAFEAQKAMPDASDAELEQMRQAVRSAYLGALVGESDLYNLIDIDEDAGAFDLVKPGERQAALEARMDEAGIFAESGDVYAGAAENAIVVKSFDKLHTLLLDDDTLTATLDGNALDFAPAEYYMLRIIICNREIFEVQLEQAVFSIYECYRSEKTSQIIENIDQKLDNYHDGVSLWFDWESHCITYLGSKPRYRNSTAEVTEPDVDQEIGWEPEGTLPPLDTKALGLPFELDVEHWRLTANGKQERPHSNAFRVLHKLLCNPGKLLTYEELREGLFDQNPRRAAKDPVQRYIGYLRSSLRAIGVDPSPYIKTKTGKGYWLQLDEAHANN